MNPSKNSEVRPVARFSQHRPRPIQLPDDPKLATATVLGYVLGQDGIDRAAAIEALKVRATALTGEDPDEAIQVLAGQLQVLNALFLVFSTEAMSTAVVDARAKYVKMALNAQNAYARTQALVIGLRLQNKGKARVTLTDTDGCDL